MIRVKIGLCSLLLCWALPACSSPAPQSEGSTEVQTLSREQMLVISMFSPPAGMFHPLYYRDAYTANLLAFIYEPLFKLDEQLQWQPVLVKDWAWEDGQKTLVLRLRDDVLWHDGQLFHAEDVQYTYEVLASPEYTGVRNHYVQDLLGYEEFRQGQAERFAGVELVDSQTVKFHFAKAVPNPLQTVSLYIIPKHVYSKYRVSELPKAPASTDFSQLVGTGAYKAESFLSQEAYTFRRNLNYWGGTPQIEAITWRVVHQDVAPGLLIAGEIDLIATPGGVKATDYAFLQKHPQIVLYETPSFGYQYLGFKLHRRTGTDNKSIWEANAKLADPKLRQAIAYSIDRQAIVEGLLQGKGSVLHAPFHSSSWAYSHDLQGYTYDPKQAVDVLTEAGFLDQDGDGFREQPDGQKLSLHLYYPSGDQVREKAALVIQRNLSEVGILVKLRPPRDVSMHYSLVQNDHADLDLFVGGIGLNAHDPDPSLVWMQDSLFNYARWQHKESDQLLQAARESTAALQQEFRQAKYREWAELFRAEVPILPLYSPWDIYAYHQRVKGIKPLPHTIFNDLHTWYLEEERVQG